MIKKTYIPGKPRNPKLSATAGTSRVGKSEFNQVVGSSHEHPNKDVLDQITEAMLVAALRDLITSTDTESELTDENMLSSLRVLSEIAKNNESFLEELKQRFLSKIEPDTAQKLITFTEGIEVGDFTTGALGAGAAIKMIDGTSFAEVDHLTVRQKATFRELIIEALKHIGGQLVLTPARMKCVRVVDGGSFYKCYFDTGDGEVSNEFVEGDLARCQVFTGSGTKFYWRLVTSVGEDWINLSKTSAAVGSDVPEAGDDIVQLGNATDTSRQSAIILSTVGADAPSWKQYSGINSFSLEGKETTVFSKLGNKIEGKTVFTSGGTNLDDHLDGVAQDILDALQAAQDAEDKAQQAIEDAAANVADYNQKFADIQAQVDGEISNYSYPYTPTLANYPASDWTTDIEKDRHIGDVFHNSQAYVDNETTPDAGKAWRFVKNGTAYSWTPIADSDAVKAIQEASKAQAMADGKSTTFLITPSNYKLGDMWVLNADQTVNGTAYKQGEILTATQDSETFNEAHWLKRIRYTDDTAIDNLQIGGRNLADWGSIIKQGSYENIGGNKYLLNPKKVNDGFKPKTDKLIVGEEAVLSYKIKYISGYIANFGGHCSQSVTKILVDGVVIPNTYYHGGLNKSYIEDGEEHLIQIFFKKNTTPSASAHIGIELNRYYNDPFDSLIEVWDIKLEKGNKPTDWSPAPEDVEANIAAAKAEAENAAKAYADTKAEAERVLAEAYADGKVNAEEQARIDDVNAKLAAAKAYADAQDALLKTQQEAYADGKASAAELAAIAAAEAYADLKKTEAQAYADGKVSAEEARAIADATAKFNEAKTHAEQLVEDIEIGGRNLIRGFSYWNRLGGFTHNSSDNSINIVDTPNYYNPAESHNVYLSPNSTYTLSCNAPIVQGECFIELQSRPDGGAVQSLVKTPLILGANVFTFNSGVLPEGKTHYTLRFYGRSTSNNITVKVKDIKLEKGNKPTDWTPAPEDVDKKISDVDAKAAEALAKANKSAAITDKFKTTIDGGLINTVMVELREADTQDVTAGHSGIQGALKNLPAYWAGGTYGQAIGGTAKAIIRHDGSSKFSDTEITGVINALNGEIGNFNIQDGKLTANYSYMTHLPSGAYVQVTSNIQLTSGGIIISNSYGGTVDHPPIVEWDVEITSTGVKVGDYEIRRTGFYEYGNKIEMGAGDYVHPSTHPASMITAGTLQGIVKANNNTSYTTKQVRNIILSTGNAVSSQMENGDIWIKYE